MFLILLCYGIASIPYSYLFSFKKSVAGGFAALLISGMFIGIILTVIVNALELSGTAYYEKLGADLKYVFLFLPQFGLTYTLVRFSRKAVQNYNWDIMTTEEKQRKCYFDMIPCCGGKYFLTKNYNFCAVCYDCTVYYNFVQMLCILIINLFR